MAADSVLGYELPRIRSCALEKATNCIVSIKGILPDGTEILAKTTGRIKDENWDWGKQSKVVGPLDEWEFPGIKFENGSGKFFVTSFYFPEGQTFCWENGQCSSHQEQLNFYANASELDGVKPSIKITGKKAELACPGNLDDCKVWSSWNFNSDIKWLVTFAMDKKFTPTITTGRIKDLKVGYDSNSNLEVEYSPLKLDHVPYDKPDIWIFDEAFYQNDSPALWIEGSSHENVKSLGVCAEGGGLQVVSNAIGMGIPFWNSKTESIEVGVRSPHFAADGLPLKGYLEVRIPKKMAKCLWNVDLSGQVSGKVSITYTDSTTPEVLTVTGSVNGNDYLLVSTGYHYSSPTVAIQIKNTKIDETVKPVTEVLPAAVAQPTKILIKNTFSCKKGLKVKKVTTTGTKCPAGYKKIA